MRKSPTNPVMHGLEGRSLQVLEQPVWMKDYDDAYSICGRCRTSFPAYDLEFTWGNNKPTKVTVNPDSDPSLPRSDWCYAYDSVRMPRRKMVQVGSWDQYLLETGPTLTYVNCHWSSQYFGATRRHVNPGSPMGTPYDVTLNSIPNLQWYLWYGNTLDAVTGQPPQLPVDVDTTQFVMDPLDDDSNIQPVGGVDPSNGSAVDPVDGACSGWCLALLRRRILISIGGEIVRFSPYTMYQLATPSNQQKPVFNCRSANQWVQVFNPLNLPSHTIRTIPAGP